MARKKGAKFQGVVAKFQLQLGELLAVVESSETHFVRCIKPNMVKSGTSWDSETVTKQLTLTLPLTLPLTLTLTPTLTLTLSLSLGLARTPNPGPKAILAPRRLALPTALSRRLSSTSLRAPRRCWRRGRRASGPTR